MKVKPDKQNIKNALGVLRTFTKPSLKKSYWQSISTLIFLWGSLFVSFWSFNKYPALLLLSIPSTIIYMCRSFAIEHDCGHQNLFNHKLTNDFFGSLLGFGIGIPYQMWKFIHKSHHNNVGNLTFRNLNPEIWTMTLQEYKGASSVKQLLYRFMRSKFTRLVLTPTINYGIVFRLVHPKYNLASIISVLLHNVLYILGVYFLLTHISLSHLFVVFFLPLICFYAIAAFTVYIQHQFEDTYWQHDDEWNYFQASFDGAALINAPKWFKWLTGYITYHNIHHLMPSIPNYHLEEAKTNVDRVINYPSYSMKQAFQMFDYKIWDEDKNKLIRLKKI
jgi:omega-6 fatty acid desaturase (delta-12 desaturase)